MILVGVKRVLISGCDLVRLLISVQVHVLVGGIVEAVVIIVYSLLFPQFHFIFINYFKVKFENVTTSIAIECLK